MMSAAQPGIPATERRLLILAEDPLARAGLANLLEGRAGIEVVGQEGPHGSAENRLAVYLPDVVLWDLGWSPDPEVESVRRALEEMEEFAGREALLIALLADRGLAPAVWAAGARGLLPRAIRGRRLSAAIQAVAEGMLVFEPGWSPFPVPELNSDDPPQEALTPRELEVLSLMAEGLANKTIGARLGVSEHTVKFHVNAILRKLGSQSRTEAVVRATRLGWIML